ISECPLVRQAMSYGTPRDSRAGRMSGGGLSLLPDLARSDRAVLSRKQSTPFLGVSNGKTLCRKVRLCRLSNLFGQQVDTNRRFQFQKGGQLFICTHNEPPFRRRDGHQQRRLFARSNQFAETQPQLHPASLRLSAMISHYFTPMDSASFSLYTAMMK